MKIQKLLILLLIALSLVPAYYINNWLQKVVQPRRSFLQLILYIVVGLLLVFGYTFLLVMLITKVFPHTKG